MTDYALFHNGKQVSKVHKWKMPVIIEAFEHGAIVDCPADFLGDPVGKWLADGYEVKPVEDER